MGKVFYSGNILGKPLKQLDADKVFKPIPPSKFFDGEKAFTTKKKKRTAKPKALTSRIWDASETDRKQLKKNANINVLGL